MKIKITTVIDGKQYKFKKYYGNYPCESCDMRETYCEMGNNRWEGLSVCDALPGVWK